MCLDFCVTKVLRRLTLMICYFCTWWFALFLKNGLEKCTNLATSLGQQAIVPFQCECGVGKVLGLLVGVWSHVHCQLWCWFIGNEFCYHKTNSFVLSRQVHNFKCRLCRRDRTSPPATVSQLASTLPTILREARRINFGKRRPFSLNFVLENGWRHWKVSKGKSHVCDYRGSELAFLESLVVTKFLGKQEAQLAHFCTVK